MHLYISTGSYNPECLGSSSHQLTCPNQTYLEIPDHGPLADITGVATRLFGVKAFLNVKGETSVSKPKNL